MNNKGFTLIELLVVIAIIGILAGIIIVSLDGTSDNANFARIQSDMNQIRTQMELEKIETGSYPLSVAAADQNLSDDITASHGTGTGNFSTAAYCYQVTGPGSTGTWCIDSTGYSGSADGCTATYTCATGD